MAFMRAGIASMEEAWAKWADYETGIKKIGFQHTPFFSTISSVAAKDRSADVKNGHMWNYDKVPDGDINNAFIEGADAPKAKSYHGESLKNHYQIVSNTFGVTGTSKKASYMNGESVEAYQRKQAVLEHTMTIEKILLSDQAAVQRDDATAGKCAGIGQFLTTNNVIEAAGADLSWKLLREILKIGFIKGGSPFTHLMMNTAQKDKIDDILFSKTLSNNFATTRLENNVTIIGQTAYGNNIKLILNPFMDENMVLAIKPADIYKVNWRPMEEMPLAHVGDRFEYQLISEFTLRVSTPYSVAAIKNLKVD